MKNGNKIFTVNFTERFFLQMFHYSGEQCENNRRTWYRWMKKKASKRKQTGKWSEFISTQNIRFLSLIIDIAVILEDGGCAEFPSCKE